MLAAQGAAGVVEEGNGGNDGLAGKPRKSWLMRKRQERAAIKEGLAEWQVGALVSHASWQAELVHKLSSFSGGQQANPYFCAGRVTVPAVMDTFASTTFLKGCAHHMAQ